jgi:hypothetical protein
MMNVIIANMTVVMYLVNAQFYENKPALMKVALPL